MFSNVFMLQCCESEQNRKKDSMLVGVGSGRPCIDQ